MTDGIEYISPPVSGAGASGDHGDLTGLADDDHPQYETSAEAAAKVTAHEAAANPHSVYALDTDLSTHEADTTAIHGIADTSALATSSSVTSAVSTHAGLADPHTGYVLESLLDAKGDLIAASADNTPAKVTAGANETVLVADSTQAAGLKWATSGTRTFPKPAFWSAYPSVNNFALSANVLRGSFVTVPVRTTVSHARIGVTTSSGNISVGLYTFDGATRLATTGAIACPAGGGFVTLDFTGAVTLEPSVYFIGLSSDNGTATFYATASAGAQVLGGTSINASHPAPTSLTPDGNSGGQVPVIGLY